MGASTAPRSRSWRATLVRGPARSAEVPVLPGTGANARRRLLPTVREVLNMAHGDSFTQFRRFMRANYPRAQSSAQMLLASWLVTAGSPRGRPTRVRRSSQSRRTTARTSARSWLSRPACDLGVTRCCTAQCGCGLWGAQCDYRSHPQEPRGWAMSEERAPAKARVSSKWRRREAQPYEVGNTAALKSGAWSDRVVDPVAVAVTQAVLARRHRSRTAPRGAWPRCGSSGGPVSARGRSLREGRALRRRGQGTAGPCVRRPVRAAGIRLRARLGLDPRSEAELVTLQAEGRRSVKSSISMRSASVVAKH